MSVLLVTGLGNAIKQRCFYYRPSKKPQMVQTGQTLRTARKHDAWQVLVTKCLERVDTLFLRACREDLTVITGATKEVQTDCAVTDILA